MVVFLKMGYFAPGCCKLGLSKLIDISSESAFLDEDDGAHFIGLKSSKSPKILVNCKIRSYLRQKFNKIVHRDGFDHSTFGLEVQRSTDRANHML